MGTVLEEVSGFEESFSEHLKRLEVTFCTILNSEEATVRAYRKVRKIILETGGKGVLVI